VQFGKPFLSALTRLSNSHERRLLGRTGHAVRWLPRTVSVALATQPKKNLRLGRHSPAAGHNSLLQWPRSHRTGDGVCEIGAALSLGDGTRAAPILHLASPRQCEILFTLLRLRSGWRAFFWISERAARLQTDSRHSK